MKHNSPKVKWDVKDFPEGYRVRALYVSAEPNTITIQIVSVERELEEQLSELFKKKRVKK